MRLGSHQFELPLILAPMAGVSDAPFRAACLKHGADLAVHEMVAAKADLRNTTKSLSRLKMSDNDQFRWVQIVGADPESIAEGASYNANLGADAIDINMGCPAKKVCKKAAGSALLADPSLVEAILQRTVESVDVPVTLKIRTGTDRDNKNAVQIAKIASNAGISCLTIHGRTRADRFNGEAEYDTIRDVRQAVDIPIIANGDIQSAEKAVAVLEHTGANALMIGRAAYGNPWIFTQIKSKLNNQSYNQPQASEIHQTIIEHITDLHTHYGDEKGVRIARKHIGWYLENFDLGEHKASINKIECAVEQRELVNRIFSEFAVVELAMAS